MSAYLIATEPVKDESMFAKYRQEVMLTLGHMTQRSLSAEALCGFLKVNGRILDW